MSDEYRDEADLDCLRRKILEEADNYLEVSESKYLSRGSVEYFKLNRRFNDLFFENKRKEAELLSLTTRFKEMEQSKSQRCTIKSKSLNAVRVEFTAKAPSIGNQRRLLIHLLSQIKHYEELISKEQEETNRLCYIQDRSDEITRNINAKVTDVKDIKQKYYNLGSHLETTKSAAHFHLLREEFVLESEKKRYLNDRQNRCDTVQTFRNRERKIKEKVTRVATSLAKSTLSAQRARKDKILILSDINFALGQKNIVYESMEKHRDQIEFFKQAFGQLRTVVNGPEDLDGIVSSTVELWEKMKSYELQLQAKYGDLCASHSKLSKDLEIAREQLIRTNKNVEVLQQMNHVKSLIGKHVTANLLEDFPLKEKTDLKCLEINEKLTANIYIFLQILLDKVIKDLKLVHLYSLDSSEDLLSMITYTLSSAPNFNSKRLMTTAQFEKKTSKFGNYNKKMSFTTDDHKPRVQNYRRNNIKRMTGHYAPNPIYGTIVSNIIHSNIIFTMFSSKDILQKTMAKHAPIDKHSIVNFCEELSERSYKRTQESVITVIYKLQSVLNHIKKEYVTKNTPLKVREIHSECQKMSKYQATNILKLVFNVKTKMLRKNKKLKHQESEDNGCRFKVLPANQDHFMEDKGWESRIKSQKLINNKQNCGLPSIQKVEEFHEDLKKVNFQVNSLKNCSKRTVSQVNFIKPMAWRRIR